MNHRWKNNKCTVCGLRKYINSDKVRVYWVDNEWNEKRPNCIEVKKVSNKPGGGKTVEQIERENKRAAAIENLKGKGDAEKKLRKIYRHLPADQIEYIIAIYEKYNSHKRKPTARIKRDVPSY